MPEPNLDAPFHYFSNTPTVDAKAVLDACIGPARVLDVIHVATAAEILPADLGIPTANISRGERILLASGWSYYFGLDDFFDRYPGISEELAVLFVERGNLIFRKRKILKSDLGIYFRGRDSSENFTNLKLKIRKQKSVPKQTRYSFVLCELLFLN